MTVTPEFPCVPKGSHWPQQTQAPSSRLNQAHPGWAPLGETNTMGKTLPFPKSRLHSQGSRKLGDHAPCSPPGPVSTSPPFLAVALGLLPSTQATQPRPLRHLDLEPREDPCPPPSLLGASSDCLGAQPVHGEHPSPHSPHCHPVWKRGTLF